MVRAIGAERHLAPILDTVARELAKVTEVPAAAVKLLSEDGADPALRRLVRACPRIWSRRR